LKAWCHNAQDPSGGGHNPDITCAGAWLQWQNTGLNQNVNPATKYKWTDDFNKSGYRSVFTFEPSQFVDNWTPMAFGIVALCTSGTCLFFVLCFTALPASCLFVAAAAAVTALRRSPRHALIVRLVLSLVVSFSHIISFPVRVIVLSPAVHTFRFDRSPLFRLFFLYTFPLSHQSTLFLLSVLSLLSYGCSQRASPLVRRSKASAPHLSTSFVLSSHISTACQFAGSKFESITKSWSRQLWWHLFAAMFG
jgi:hypothetical protein